MADAADAGNKDHTHRTDAGYLLSVVPGAAGHYPGGESQRFGRVINDLLKALRGESRMRDYRVGKAEAGLVQFAQALGFSADLVKEANKFLFVQIAQFQSQNNLSRNHVVRARLNFDPSHGANLAAGHAGHNLVD